jgi:hypothetical protein
MQKQVGDGSLVGGSQTGRGLFHKLPSEGLELLGAGASDWVIFPSRGHYPRDDAFFLECILGFFEDELKGHTDLATGEFEGWKNARRDQLKRGELVYIAHQLDFLARNGEVEAHGQ